MERVSNLNQTTMGLVKTPSGFLKKGIAQYTVTSGTDFTGLTQLPVFEIQKYNDSSYISKISSTQVQLLAGKKYRMTADGNNFTGEFGFYNVTSSTYVGVKGNSGQGAEVIIIPTTTTTIEIRTAGSFGIQTNVNIVIEEVETTIVTNNYSNKILVYNTQADVSIDIEIGQVIQTLGGTTKGDGLGSIYIIESTLTDGFTIATGKHANKMSYSTKTQEITDSSNKIATTQWINDKCYGVGQTWYNETANRVLSQIYVNTDVKTITVRFVKENCGQNIYFKIYVNETLVGGQQNTSIGLTLLSDEVKVPIGASYKILSNGSIDGFTTWLEYK